MARLKSFFTVITVSMTLQLVCQKVANAIIEKRGYEGPYIYEGVEYDLFQTQYGSQGYIEEYSNLKDLCTSWIMIPGFQLSAIWVQGVAYLLILFYLFLGIALVADIFMESIETITSKTTLVTIPSAEGNIVIEKPVWNPTIANLTLMALGSSAPEIILSVSEVAKDIEAVPGMLGPMTIVGSASFNLMVISAVSIMAVTEVKKIYDLNVFFITVVSSTWAYVWYFLVLSVITPDEVTLLEAGLTVGYMVILLIFAYSADRCTARSTDAKEEEENNKKLAMKARLRLLGKKYGMKAIVECCYEQKPDGGVRVKANDAADIQDYFRRLLDVQDLHAVPLDEIIDCMNPENPVERIAYRRQVAAAAPKSFVKVKGGAKDEALTGEAAIIHDNNENMNADIGFKHAKYEVAEGNQVVNVTIVKKCKEDFTVRVRTVDVQAVAPKDYEAKDEYITIKHHETERIIQIKIVNDAEWEPDKDFKVELLGDDGLRLAGNDSECVVTIIDDEKPGVLGFEDRFVNIKRSKAMATLKILRTQGSDGVVECRVFTAEPDNADVIEGEPAVVNEDFKELDEQVVFEAGVVERTVQIQLPECTDMGEMIKSFRVQIDDVRPEGVKLSKKSICFVNIEPDEGNDALEQANIDRTRMIEYFISNKEIRYSQHFKIACMLGPTIDEDNMMDDVTIGEAIMHLLTIFWKVVFSIIPPKQSCGGWGAFMVALTIIGVITVIVGEIATILGCAIGLEPAVTGITLVAMGTSLPDTFASQTAARNSANADSAIGNVTGSNSVNVFLGVGLPWIIGTLHRHMKYGTTFYVPAGSLTFSVIVFLSCSMVTFFILGLRRCCIGGELGGPGLQRPLSAFIIFSLWIAYVTLCSLEAYGVFAEE